MLAKKCAEATVNFMRKHGKNTVIEFAGVVGVTWITSTICDKIELKKNELKNDGRREVINDLMHDFEMMAISGYADFKIPGEPKSFVGAGEAHAAYKESRKSKW